MQDHPPSEIDTRADAPALRQHPGRAAAVRVDHAEASLEGLHALSDGRWTIVDRFDHEGRRFLVVRRATARAETLSGLSPREREVAHMAAAGVPNKVIAYELDLSGSTVSSHLASAMRRLGVRTRAELTAMLELRTRLSELVA